MNQKTLSIHAQARVIPMQKIKLPQAIHKLATANYAGHTTLLLKGLTITFAISALYFQDLSIVFTDAFRSEQTYHILAIPFLLAYLLYRKRKMISAAAPQKESVTVGITQHFQTLIGILLTSTAVIVYWYGSYTFTPLEYHCSPCHSSQPA
jgi:hypothetical protein